MKKNGLLISIIIYLLSPLFMMAGNYFKNYSNFFYIIQNIFLVISTVYLLYYAYKEKKNINFKLLLFIFLMYFACAFAITLVNVDFNFALSGNEYRREGIITHLSYINFIFYGYILVKQKKFILITKIFSLISFMVVLITLLNNDFTYKTTYNNLYGFSTFSGPFFHFNHYGYYLLIGSISSIYLFFTSNRIKKILYFIMMSFHIYLLILNNTFGSYIALFITIILITILIKKQWIEKIVLLTILINLSLMGFRDGKNVVMDNLGILKEDYNSFKSAIKTKEDIGHIGTERGALWSKGYELILENPIVGYGLDNANKPYSTKGIQLGRAHNIIIDISLTSGLLGLILFFGPIGIMIIYLLKNLKRLDINQRFIIIGIVGYLANMMTGLTMFYTAPYLYILLGALFKIYYEKRN